jgi:cytochrome c oxidase assembly protein Cox11
MFRQAFKRLYGTNAKAGTSQFDLALYCMSGSIAVIGIGYGMIPLYAWFCQETGFSGPLAQSTFEELVMNPKKMIPFKGR